MDEQRHMREPVRVRTIWGILLMAAGLLVFLHNFGIWDIDWSDIFTWQMVLMVVGLFMLSSRGSRQAGWALFLLGAFFWAFRFIDLSETLRKLLWPVGLMVGGLALMVGWRSPAPSTEEPASGAAPPDGGAASQPTGGEPNAMYLNYSTALSSRRFKPSAQRIAGGEVRSTLGMAIVDLSGTTLSAPSVRLRVSCFAGGCTLIVPPSWRVQVDANPIMGSVSDLRPSSPPVDGPLLIVDGRVTMGSCRIEQV